MPKKRKTRARGETAAAPGTFEQIRDLYFSLERNFNALFSACQADAERDQFRLDYIAARGSFWKAQNHVFNENDPHVQELSGRLKEHRSKIEQDLAGLQLTATTLKTITSAVQLVTTIMALA